MRIIGCDLHAQQQRIAMLDDQTGEYVEKVLPHAGDPVRQFLRHCARAARVGIKASGSMHWFLQLLAELGMDCQVGHPAKIRAAEPRKQKHELGPEARAWAEPVNRAGSESAEMKKAAFQGRPAEPSGGP